MLSYPEADKRGKYLGIWAAMRNSGAIAGGAINFGNNSKNSAGGGVAWSTYLIFIGFGECLIAIREVHADPVCRGLWRYHLLDAISNQEGQAVRRYQSPHVAKHVLDGRTQGIDAASQEPKGG
jgi:hypothetical protein